MAVDKTQLALHSSVNGFGLYRYDTLDTHATVRASGYFDNSILNLNLAVGDIIEVFVWATAVRSGTIAAYGKHVVLTVSAAGVVDLSDETVGVVANT